MKTAATILHICPARDWQTAQKQGFYTAASLEAEGFIHCSRVDQVVAVANRYFGGELDLVVLWIDPGRLQPELRWDPVGEQVYPHLYGPLNLDAVQAVTPLAPEGDGIFRRLPASP